MVPRTCLGPLILSSISKVIQFLVNPIMGELHPDEVQNLVRLVLLLLNVHAFSRLAFHLDNTMTTNSNQSINKNDSFLGNYFLIICACQFHIPFYCSRTLPNIFSMWTITHAFADWFQGQLLIHQQKNHYYIYRSAAWIVSSIVLFRCDMIILLFTVGLSMIIQGQMTIPKAIFTGIVSGVCSLILTVILDSIFWQRLVWPEGEVLFFNTVENKSSEWGVMPYHWYWTSALPKAMLLTIFLIPFSFLHIPEWILCILQSIFLPKSSTNTLSFPPFFIPMNTGNPCKYGILPFLVPILAFIGLYSILPHKEVRFLFPALSMLNIAAACGITRLHKFFIHTRKTTKKKERNQPADLNKKNKSITSLFLFICGIITIVITFIGSALFLWISSFNYPGGEALHMLQQYIEHHPNVDRSTPIVVHIDVASAETGVSCFGQRFAEYNPSNMGKWIFVKAGYEEDNSNQLKKLSNLTHLLSENEQVDGYHSIGVVQGLPRFNWKKRKVETEDYIFLLEQDGWLSFSRE